MRTVTIEELEKIPQEMRFVIDMRQEEDYRRGTLPGAVNIPDLNLEAWDGELPEDKILYVFSETDRQSSDAVEKLIRACDNGKGGRYAGKTLTFCNVEGGYRLWLRRELDRQAASEEEIALRRAKIERSIIKKYRRQLWSQFTKAVRDYELIQEGDRIAVCISGGKDSMLMAKLMQEIQLHGKAKFDLVFLCMNPGYHPDNWKVIENNAKLLGIDLTVFESNIFDYVSTVDHHPCYLCARMRRGFLYGNAKKLGCNKIALGHHYDDVIETILMGILYSGKTETMLPKLHSQNFEGMELIRPMYLIREESVKAWRDYNDLHFIQCACRFTEMSSYAASEHTSKRAEVKKLIASLCEKEPVIAQNIFNCVRDINLRTILGYHRDGKAYHFLDDYEEGTSSFRT